MLSLGVVPVVHSEPAQGVTSNVIGRATFDAFNLQSDPHVMAFSAQANGPVDIIVRMHDYAPGSSTGWHSHPGPVLIEVVEGQVTFYERDDPTCTPKVVSKGQGYVDTGMGHIGRNETGAPARDVTRRPASRSRSRRRRDRSSRRARRSRMPSTARRSKAPTSTVSRVSSRADPPAADRLTFFRHPPHYRSP